MSQPEEEMQQTPVDQTPPEAYQVTDSHRCQYVLALPKEMAAEKLIDKVRKFFKDHDPEITEGAGKGQFELHQREMADGKQALVIRVPGDRSTLKEFLKFLEDQGLKLLKTVVNEIKKLFEKEPWPFLKEAAEKTESLFGSGPGHGLGRT